MLSRAPVVTAWSALSNNVAPGMWWNDAGLRRCNWILACYVFIQATGGYDKSLLNNLQSMPKWQELVDHPSSSALGLITCSMSLGTIATAPFFGWMADKYGRRLTMFAGSALMLVGAILQAAANGRDMFIAGRVIIGAGVSGSLNSGPLLVAEISHPRQRATYSAFYNTLWYVGSTVCAWLSFGTSWMDTSSFSWRIPAIGQAIPAAFTVIAVYWLPESPRWLVKNGRAEEAHQMLAKFHANGKMDDELVMYEMATIREALAVEEANPSKGLLGDWAELFSTKGNRYRMFVMTWFVLGIDWCGTAITSYYLTKILNSVGVTSATEQCVAVWNIITAMSGAMMAESLGRRKLWLVSFVGMLLVNVPFGVCSALFAKNGNLAAGKAVIAFSYLYQGTYNLGCNPLPYLYAPELWPLRLRSKAMSYEVALDATMGVLGQYTTPIALDSLQWRMYFVYTAFLVVWIVGIYFTFPETKGCTLEEIAVIFGDGAENVEALRIEAVDKNAGSKGEGESDSEVKV
ncbi:hypothetical protein JCM10207_004219 [Rhodosporidiobolus poonsookiae]